MVAMRNCATLSLFAACAAMSCPVIADAAVPVTLAVEGALRTPSGGPVTDGNYKVAFALYATKLAPDAAWKEGPVALPVQNGRFSYALGGIKPITAQLIASLKPGWLGVTVESGPELLRQPLHAVAWAIRAGAADALGCSGCVTGAHLAPGTVSADKVGFTFAGSKTKGGPAKAALDLQCTGCVTVSKMKFDGDVDLGGNALKGAKISAQSVVAQTISAAAFVGDGSKLSGIKTPAGSCSAMGQVVKGIAADGKLICVTALDPSALPPDALDDVSAGALSNLFVDEIAAQGMPKPIPDNNPIGVSSTIDFPDLGLAKKLTIKAHVTSSNIKHLKLELFAPDNSAITLYGGGGTGTKLQTSWPTPSKPIKGDLSGWAGKNPKGKWRLKAIDSKFDTNKTDGAIVSWSVAIDTISSKKVKLAGDLLAKGVIQVGSGTLCNAGLEGALRYNKADKTVEFCDGKAWKPLYEPPSNGSSQAKAGLTCKKLLDDGQSKGDGKYWLDPNGPPTADAFLAWCDMKGGGWTRIQLHGGRTSASHADCSPHKGYGTNDFMGSGHLASCSGNQAEVTWHDHNNKAISAGQVKAMNGLKMNSKPTPNWIRDADGNTDNVLTCLDNTQLVSWAWSPKSQKADNSCFKTSNAITTPVFNKWSASTGAQQSGQDWYLERYWFFRE